MPLGHQKLTFDMKILLKVLLNAEVHCNATRKVDFHRTQICLTEKIPFINL